MHKLLNLDMDNKEPSGASSPGSKGAGGSGLFGSAGPQYSKTELAGVPCESTILYY